MKAKLIIDNKEIEIEISQEELNKLQPKNTGYERVDEGDVYYYVNYRRDVKEAIDYKDESDHTVDFTANYYSSKTVAENNARTDQLMRQLRRFAVEHREKEINWSNDGQMKHFIAYNYDEAEIITDYDTDYRFFGNIYFDSQESVKAAIKEFYDELIWYFTEYKDSL